MTPEQIDKMSVEEARKNLKWMAPALETLKKDHSEYVALYNSLVKVVGRYDSELRAANARIVELESKS